MRKRTIDFSFGSEMFNIKKREISANSPTIKNLSKRIYDLYDLKTYRNVNNNIIEINNNIV
jgi:hypothetical protein